MKITANGSWGYQFLLLYDYFYKVGLEEVPFVSQNMQKSKHFLEHFKSSQAKRTAEAIALCEALGYSIDRTKSTIMMWNYPFLSFPFQLSTETKCFILVHRETFDDGRKPQRFHFFWVSGGKKVGQNFYTYISTLLHFTIRLSILTAINWMRLLF